MKRGRTFIASFSLILILLLVNVLTTSAHSNIEISTDKTSAVSNPKDVASLDNLLVTVTGLKKGDTATVTLLPEPALASNEFYIKRTLTSEGTENIVTDMSYPLKDGDYKLQLSAPDEYFREPEAWLFMVSNSQLVNPLGKSAVFKLIPPESQKFKPYRGPTVLAPIDSNTVPPAPPSEPPSTMKEWMLSLSAPAKQPISETSSPSGLATQATQLGSETALSSSPGYWLTGWDYRKRITITGSSAGEQTNYQMKLNVNYGSGTDSGNSVYLNNHSRSDFGDVRFTKSDGTTFLDYWQESYVSGSSAVFWVEFDSIPVSPNTANFYIYYGNNITSVSNGDNTFPFFDDFGGTSLNPSKWTSGGSVSVSGGQVTLTGLESASNIISTATQLYGAAHWKGSATNNYYTYLMWGNSPSIGRIEWNWQQSGRYFLTWANSNHAQTGPISGGIPGTMYDWYILWQSGRATGYRDKSIEATHYDWVPSSANPFAFYAYKSGSAVDTIILDYAFFSKWVDPEPTWSAWEAEEDENNHHYFQWQSTLVSPGIWARFTVSNPGVRHVEWHREFAVDHIYAAKDISSVQHWMEVGWAEVGWSYSDTQYMFEYDYTYDDWRFWSIPTNPLAVALQYFSGPNKWYARAWDGVGWGTLAAEDIGFSDATIMWNGGEVFTLYPDHPSFPSATTDVAQLYLNGWVWWDSLRSATTSMQYFPSNSPYDVHTAINYYDFYIHYHQ